MLINVHLQLHSNSYMIIVVLTVFAYLYHKKCFEQFFLRVEYVKVSLIIIISCISEGLALSTKE